MDIIEESSVSLSCNARSDYFRKYALGCGNIHCPEFPANLPYFPYSVWQELKFVNSYGENQIFVISETKNSTPNSFHWKCKCVCSVLTYFNAINNQDSLCITGEFLISGRQKASSVHIMHNIQKGNFKYDHLATDIQIQNTPPYDKVAKYVDEIIVIERDENCIITKVIIVKHKGIVFYTTVDGEEWKLVE